MESRISSIADFQGSFRLSSLDSLGLAPDGFLDRISAVSFDVKAQCDGGEETNRKSVIGYDIAAAPTLDFDLSAACGGANVIIYNLNLQYRDVDGNLTPVAGLSADGVPFNHPVSGSQLILVRLSVPGKIANYNLQEVKIDTASNGNNVFAVNRPPTATNDGVFTVNSEQESVISVMGNDVDLDGDTIVVISVGSPSNGNAVLAADGKIYYTSNTSYVGPDSFTYRLKDSAGNFSGPATVTLNVQ